MITASIDRTELRKGWSEAFPEVAFASGLVVSAVDGPVTSQIISVTLKPGKSVGRHAHSAEEILLVLEGTAELRIGERRERLPAGRVAVIPAKVAHESVNIGRETLRFLVIFPSAVVLHNWDVPVEPFGSRTFVTPPAMI